VSLDESGFLKREGDLANAAKISARLVTDFDPGIVILAFIGLLAGVRPDLKGACQFAIWVKSTRHTKRRDWVKNVQKVID